MALCNKVSADYVYLYKAVFSVPSLDEETNTLNNATHTQRKRHMNCKYRVIYDIVYRISRDTYNDTMLQ